MAFESLDGASVRKCNRGPTVWSFAHVGTQRTFTFQGILRCRLCYRGYRLNHVMNLTEFDDRNIQQPAAPAGSELPLPTMLSDVAVRVWDSALSAVSAKIAGVDATVSYAGPVAGVAGLDEVQILIPRSLAGRGEAAVELIVDGKRANTVTLSFQ
jgi:cysteinyl-tRNA synthetase